MVTLVMESDALCRDGYRGEVRGVVVDPAARIATHIVVEPKGRLGLARLVPLDLVDATSGQVRLQCTEAEFENLEAAEETLAEFVPGYPAPVQLLPPGWRGAGGPTVEGGTIPRIPEMETIDIIPPGEVEERRGDRVYATDGDIGRVHAFRIEPDSRRITHVVLKEGPAWARKDLAIPFGKVAGFGHGIRLSISKQEVQDLPPIDAGHPAE